MKIFRIILLVTGFYPFSFTFLLGLKATIIEGIFGRDLQSFMIGLSPAAISLIYIMFARDTFRKKK